MGFVTNRWQPVNTGPGPIPVPTWERVANGVTATTNFNFSNLDYTEYLILVYHRSTTTTLYEMFYAPEFGTANQHAGYTNQIIYLAPQSKSTLKFTVYEGSSSNSYDRTSNYRYIIYGRNKLAWSRASDQYVALPEYTELATTGGYYTPFNYQDFDYRVGGGSRWIQYTSGYRPIFDGAVEQVYSNKYSGNPSVYTRLSSNEANWNHITSTSSSVSIADISYTEMFIVAKRMQHSYSGSNRRTFQSLYVIPDMVKGTYDTGGYTGEYSGTRYNGSYGSITTSATSISATCYLNVKGSPTYTFESLDIYYR